MGAVPLREWGDRREGQRVERNLERAGRQLGRRRVTALAVAAAALLGAGVWAPAASAQDGVAPLQSAISVTTDPSGAQGPCAPAGALTYEVLHDPASFTLRIRANAPLCQPVSAVAAIYSMPGNGIAWPQQLAEVRNFTIGEAGTVDVRFTKTCQPAQFDVLTGATPDTVAPWGQWHGQLLFPFDVDTTYQHWGGECPAPPSSTTTTTTTAPTTTTTTTEAPAVGPDDDETSTTVPEVLGATEEPPPGGAPEVLGVTQEAEPSALAFTGMSFRILAVAGLSLFLAGVAIAALGRRSA